MQTKTIVLIAILIALTFTIQMAGLPIFITGPFINCMLLLITYIVGLWGGILLGCLTPVVALIRGHLPPALYPALPFVVLGNISLVIVFYMIQRRKEIYSLKQYILSIIAIIPAAITKFSLLTLSVKWILPILMGVALPSPFVVIMTLPQLFTALIGGALFLVLVKILRIQKA